MIKREADEDLYYATFEIMVKVDFGHSVAITGELEELGNWKKYTSYILEWNEGDKWVSPYPIVSKKPYFQYKYIVLDTRE